MFTQNFNSYACDGDSIECERNGIRFVATLHRDDCDDRPDERQDGFWPNLNPTSAGYIGPKSESTLRRHHKRAAEVMQAWKDDEWWYVGVCVQAFVGDIELTDEYGAALWGIECNYPERSKTHKPNNYLRDVANDLLDECETAAREKSATLKTELEAI